MNGNQKLFRRRRFHNHPGVTLLELIMVLTIISILVAVTALAFNSSHEHAKLQQAADRLIADLRLVGNQARRDQQTYELVVDTANRRYQATGVINLKGTEDISVDLGAAPYDVSSITMLFGGETKVKFDPKGHVYPGGSIVLRARDKQMVINVNEVGTIEQQN